MYYYILELPLFDLLRISLDDEQSGWREEDGDKDTIAQVNFFYLLINEKYKGNY